jgi:uncharacterized protein YxeA
MKKISILALLALAISGASFASTIPLGENSTFTIINKSDVKYELVYIAEEPSDVRVSIYNESGQNVSTRLVKDVAKFKRTYDFSKLEPGTYKVVVKNDDGVAREEINHLVKEARLKSFVTNLPTEKALKVHVGDFNPDQPVSIRIYDEQNNIIFRDKIRNSHGFSRVYKMPNLNSEVVQVTIENNGEIVQFDRKLKN